MSAGSRPGPDTVLSARGIVNRFGKQLVHDKIDLDIRRGEILGIAGGSGSGKSVLLKTLIGLHCPNHGKVLLNGKPVASMSPGEMSSQIGVLFQQGALFSSLSVAQNVMLPLREHTRLGAEDREKIASVKLELAGMSPDSALKFPAQLSGGMIKRAALARALALDPRVLFLDEPTSDLDPLTAGGIDELILKINRGLGITVVIVTHDLTTLFTVCDRVALLVDGKITVDTIEKLSHSRDAWTHEFMHGPRAQGAIHARKSSHGIG